MIYTTAAPATIILPQLAEYDMQLTIKSCDGSQVTNAVLPKKTMMIVGKKTMPGRWRLISENAISQTYRIDYCD